MAVKKVRSDETGRYSEKAKAHDWQGIRRF